MHNPHIVALINILESQNHIHLVTEFCQLGDLATFVRKRDKLATHPVTAEMMRNYPNPPNAGFHEVICRHFVQQIAIAMKFLLSRNIVHRDLKPQNLLLNPPQSWIAQDRPENRPYQVTEDSFTPQAGVTTFPVLKIADFGFARYLPQTTLAETLCGSPLYMAPEILRYEKYDNKADLWSIGAVTYELCVGKPPFRAANHVELLQKIQRSGDKIQFPEHANISQDMKDLICGLLKQMPTERMSWKVFFAHPVINDDIPGLLPSDVPAAKKASESSLEVTAPKAERGVRPSDPVDEQQPPRPVSNRAASEIQTSKPLVNRRLSSVQQNRPTLTSHATDTAVQGMRHDRMASVPVEKGKSQDGHPPPSPPTRPEPERRRTTQHARSKISRDERERAALDVAFERDYVMVEKRAVEVNAFADEMAASPRLQSGVPRSSPTSNVGAMLRRATTQGLPTLNPGQSSPSKHSQTTPTFDGIHQRKLSYERNLGERKQSTNSAITAALQNAASRVPFLFPQAKGIPTQQLYGPFPTFPVTPAGPLKIGDSSKPLSLHEDQKVVNAIEEDATRSDVVFGFAEVKYKQLAPMAPSTDNRLGIYRANEEDLANEDDDVLTVDAIVGISEEALVLYIKALAILTNTIRLAGVWWNQRGRTQSHAEPSVSPMSSEPPPDKNAEIRINQVVQWARNRFNECLEKSEYANRRLADAQRKTTRSRESSRPSSSTSQNIDSKGVSSDVRLSGGVTAEKIMYDRAVDMSRAAAVNELVGQDLQGCEVSYSTAIKLLEAVLEVDEELAEQKRKGSRRDKDPIDEEEDNAIEGIEEGDRKSVLASKHNCDTLVAMIQ